MHLKVLLFMYLILLPTMASDLYSTQGPEPILEIGCSESGEYIFGWIKTVQLDHRGYIYTFDAQRDRFISVFNLNGDKIGTIGKPGNGPGEFTGLTNFHLDNENEVLTALDFRQSKISEFSISDDSFGDIINELFFQRYSVSSPQAVIPRNVFKLADGNFVIHYEGIISPQTSEYPAKHRIILMEGETAEQVKIITLRADEKDVESDGRTVEVFKWPFAGSSTITVASSGVIYTGWSYDNTIDIYDTTGERAGNIFISREPIPMSSLEKSSILSDYPRVFIGIRRKVRNLMHDNWPIYEQKVIDDNEILWVGVYDENLATTWIGYDADGEKVSQFFLPNRDLIKSINGNYFAAVRSMELGAECVVIYKK